MFGQELFIGEAHQAANFLLSKNSHFVCFLACQPSWVIQCQIHLSWKIVVVLFNPQLGVWLGIHTFPKGICPKVNVIARLEFELAYYNSAVQRFNHYATRTRPRSILYYKIDFWLIVWVSWHVKLCRLFYTKSIFLQINSSSSKKSVKSKYSVEFSKTFLFQAIQFSKQFLFNKFSLVLV